MHSWEVVLSWSVSWRMYDDSIIYIIYLFWMHTQHMPIGCIHEIVCTQNMNIIWVNTTHTNKYIFDVRLIKSLAYNPTDNNEKELTTLRDQQTGVRARSRIHTHGVNGIQFKRKINKTFEPICARGMLPYNRCHTDKVKCVYCSVLHCVLLCVP